MQFTTVFTALLAAISVVTASPIDLERRVAVSAQIKGSTMAVVQDTNAIQAMAPPLAAMIAATPMNVAAVKAAFNGLQTVTNQYFADAAALTAETPGTCAPDSAFTTQVANLNAHIAHFKLWMAGVSAQLAKNPVNQANLASAMARVSDNAAEITKIPGMLVNRFNLC
ncbi:hypothetical protein HDU76_006963 [Blyttiomyces sp. JEL0837]|nr:hypothetical protein HDU76_006963 [Blyttiomyces sp. JEL0837]